MAVAAGIFYALYGRPSVAAPARRMHSLLCGIAGSVDGIVRLRYPASVRFRRLQAMRRDHGGTCPLIHRMSLTDSLLVYSNQARVIPKRAQEDDADSSRFPIAAAL